MGSIQIYPTHSRTDNIGRRPHKYPTSTPQVEHLIVSVGNASYSVKEMMELLQLKDRKNFLTVYLNPAIEAGWLKLIFPDQPKHPKQKYRLSEKGKMLLKDRLEK